MLCKTPKYQHPSKRNKARIQHDKCPKGRPSLQLRPLAPPEHQRSLSHITGYPPVFLSTFINALDVSRHLQMLDTVRSPHDRGGCYRYSAHL